MALADKTLVCRDCEQEFLFTIREQEFFQSHGLQGGLTRCPNCRVAQRRDLWGEYKQSRQGEGGR